MNTDTNCVEGTREEMLHKIMWGDSIDRMKEAMATAIKEIEESAGGVPWDDSSICIGMYRRNGEPMIGTTQFDYESNVIAEFYSSFDDFLDEVEYLYGLGDDGWGVDMIGDLERMKDKIQERIDRMAKTIEAEAEEESDV